MYRTRISAPAFLLGAAILFQGCLGSDGSVSPGDAVPATDEEAIAVVMAADETNTELSSTDVLVLSEEASGDAALASINTCRWFREPTTIDRNVEIVVSEPPDALATASVTTTSSTLGLLHLFACEGDVPGETFKDFDDAGSLQMLFERRRPISDDRRYRGWRLAAVSGIELACEGTTRNINSVRVVSGDVDLTFTDMAELIRVGDLPRLQPNAEVQVTVDTGDASNAVYLHVHREHRTTMTDDDHDGTFSGRFVTSDRRGPHRFAVDVLSNGTIFDDAALYDSVAWGMLYLIEGENDGSDDGE